MAPVSIIRWLFRVLLNIAAFLRGKTVGSIRETHYLIAGNKALSRILAIILGRRGGVLQNRKEKRPRMARPRGFEPLTRLRRLKIMNDLIGYKLCLNRC